jgi:hypothetical protein
MTPHLTEIAHVGCISGSESIKRSLIDEIGTTINVINQLDDLSYRLDSPTSSSVGEQFRHNLDFLNTFLNGVELGRIDYNRRERDSRVSTSRSYAIERFERVSQRLKAVSRSTMSQMVSVRSEVAGSIWLPSSVVREMEFVLSHTIHHHALIAEKLAGQGISTYLALGVSPSTKNYWSRLAA